MSARHLFPHVVAEFAAILGAPDSCVEDALGVRATWRVQNPVGIEYTIIVRWCPARPERVEGAGVNSCILATTEPILMPQVYRPESMLNGLERAKASQP